jgi:hypothetical protein
MPGLYRLTKQASETRRPANFIVSKTISIIVTPGWQGLCKVLSWQSTAAHAAVPGGGYSKNPAPGTALGAWLEYIA